MKPNEAVAFVERHGVVLQAARGPVPAKVWNERVRLRAPALAAELVIGVHSKGDEKS